MQSTSNMPDRYVPPGTLTATTIPENDTAMHLSKLITAGTLLASTATALKRPYSVDMDEHVEDNEGSIRRLRTAADNNLTATIPHHPYILTVYDLVRNAVDQWGDKECLGSRSVVRTHVEEKMITKLINGVEQQVPKKWTYSELSPYKYRSYKEVGTETNNIGAGLRKLGLDPGDHIGLYAETWYLHPNTLIQRRMATFCSGMCNPISSHCHGIRYTRFGRIGPLALSNRVQSHLYRCLTTP
jgi:hypothetical protein